MSQFQIKIIALVLMIIDHVGLFLYPQFFLLRIIGRLSFPLFAWLIANGAYHTRNIYGYLARLFLFAFLAQIPFLLPNKLADSGFSELNIFFTLSIGLIGIIVIRSTKNKYVWLLAVTLCAFVADRLHVDYGYLGVSSIIAFYLFFNNLKYLILAQGLIFSLPYINYSLSSVQLFNSIEPFAFYALIIIALYNKKQGHKFGYLFYLIYPLQYLIIYFLMLKRL